MYVNQRSKKSKILTIVLQKIRFIANYTLIIITLTSFIFVLSFLFIYVNDEIMTQIFPTCSNTIGELIASQSWKKDLLVDFLPRQYSRAGKFNVDFLAIVQDQRSTKLIRCFRLVSMIAFRNCFAQICIIFCIVEQIK